jgi:hypothetical protein
MSRDKPFLPSRTVRLLPIARVLILCLPIPVVAAAARPEPQESVLRQPEKTAKGSQSPACTTWEPRRYLRDNRPFLAKVQEITAEIAVFPFQWLIYPGTVTSNLVDNTYVTHEDAQRFYHFADIARTATEKDLQDCVDYLPKATPEERALLLAVLHTSLEDDHLPVIAQHIDDYSIPFPRLFSLAHEQWRKQRRVQHIGQIVRLGEAVRAKERSTELLSPFERRVFGDINRFQVPPFASTFRKSTNGMFKLKCVSHYAQAILRLRGCGLVESMHDMSRFRGLGPPVLYTPGFDDLPTVESIFTKEAWNEFHALTLDVRRLHLEYVLQVECVPPPYQEEAVATFAERLKDVPPRTVALACFGISTSVLYELCTDRVLIPDWHEYVHRIPKEQVEELLTSMDLDGIDPFLASEPQQEHHLGYRPYFRPFLVYVLRHRERWFSDNEFDGIEKRLTPPARKARAWAELAAPDDTRNKLPFEDIAVVPEHVVFGCAWQSVGAGRRTVPGVEYRASVRFPEARRRPLAWQYWSTTPRRHDHATKRYAENRAWSTTEEPLRSFSQGRTATVPQAAGVGTAGIADAAGGDLDQSVRQPVDD